MLQTKLGWQKCPIRLEATVTPVFCWKRELQLNGPTQCRESFKWNIPYYTDFVNRNFCGIVIIKECRNSSVDVVTRLREFFDFRHSQEMFSLDL
jgi:hypothetical protein